jgi:hypothetical protein
MLGFLRRLFHRLCPLEEEPVRLIPTTLAIGLMLPGAANLPSVSHRSSSDLTVRQSEGGATKELAKAQRAPPMMKAQLPSSDQAEFVTCEQTIEGEFRDLKGPWGLDELARWQDREEVACFLAWVAVYEWRLAYLWERHSLWQWRPRVQIKGRLSWIRITREWIRTQLVERAIRAAPACL